ncbi:MAG: hypothetical protein E6R13_09715 [Spirochaetes bacterium]|nr:MAG: hypothetical protein E6R13_09715 [Spirochaetota bacterium]
MTDVTISQLPLTPNTGGLIVSGSDYVLIEDVLTGQTYKAFLPNPYNLYPPLLTNTGYNASTDQVHTTLSPLPAPSGATANSMYYVTTRGVLSTYPTIDSSGTVSNPTTLIEGDILVDNGVGQYRLLRTTASSINYSLLSLTVSELATDGSLNPSQHKGVVVPPTSVATNLLIPSISTIPAEYNSYQFFVKNNSLIDLSITFSDELEYVGSGDFTRICSPGESIIYDAVIGTSSSYWVELNRPFKTTLSSFTQVVPMSGGSIPPAQTVTLASSSNGNFILPPLSMVSTGQVFVVKSGNFINNTVSTFSGDSMDLLMNSGSFNLTNLSHLESMFVVADKVLNTWIRIS